MKPTSRVQIICFLFCLCAVAFGQTPLSSFEHIVLIVQENRTPDNLFQGLCTTAFSCSTNPRFSQYNIQTANWIDKTSPSHVTQPLTVALANTYDLDHSPTAFKRECDVNATTHVCTMDGAALVACSGTCLTQPQFRYVDNSTGTLNPYLELARQYGWANYMFQTNQGPSFPAHQFLFGGTSAPTTPDDAAGVFAAGNGQGGANIAGCIASTGTHVALIVPPGIMNTSMFPCFEHNTIPDVLPAGLTWKYYAPSAGSIWTAPDAINHICQPDLPVGGKCVGPEWVKNVVLAPQNVLTDIGKCALANVVWVIPKGQNSDHANVNSGGGPAWVSSVVNAIGSSTCKDVNGRSYWETTAVVITWDDWGGWYDHEPPTILAQPQGDYQYGFRVPMIFVSAYTRAGLVENTRRDFGSILRFIEHNFGVPEGALTFADARAKDALDNFYDLRLAPRPFALIPAAKTATFFINDKTPALDPDTD